MKPSEKKQEEPADYERLVFKNASVFHYMKICLIVDDERQTFNPAQFKHLIISALRGLYGEVGAAFPFDVLKFEEDTRTAVLRVYSSGLVKLWSALTLLGYHQNELCAFRVIQVSPILLALSGNSRDLELD
ncbi:ribonuclease P protein subunit p14 [Amia ocellicauda]|uniref:ribonuclease P protein subunit p14 n=1 Tax=Amia ocellicauda TaxID=2972642 RepID=UPI0034638513